MTETEVEHLSWSFNLTSNFRNIPHQLLFQLSVWPATPNHPATMAGDHDTYHSKDAIKAAISSSAALGGAGFFIAAVHNALQKQNVGAMSVFTRSGGIIAVMGTLPNCLSPSPIEKASMLTNLCSDWWRRIRLHQVGDGQSERKGRPVEYRDCRLHFWFNPRNDKYGYNPRV